MNVGSSNRETPESRDDQETAPGDPTQQIIRAVIESKEQPLSSASDMNDSLDLYCNLSVNLDLYRDLLESFHTVRCSLSQKRLEMLVNDIRLSVTHTPKKCP